MSSTLTLQHPCFHTPLLHLLFFTLFNTLIKPPSSTFSFVHTVSFTPSIQYTLFYTLSFTPFLHHPSSHPLPHLFQTLSSRPFLPLPLFHALSSTPFLKHVCTRSPSPTDPDEFGYLERKNTVLFRFQIFLLSRTSSLQRPPVTNVT